MEGLGRHRPVPLGHEDVRGRPLFALQTPQRAYLVALHRVDTRRAVLRPADMQAGWEAASVLAPCLLQAAAREGRRGDAGRLRAMTSAAGKAGCVVARRPRPPEFIATMRDRDIAPNRLMT